MNCVKGEIHNVLSMMRVNARWASRDRFTQEISAATQSPMMRAFKQLHYELQSVNDLADVDTVTYLLPFVMVVESEKTSGYITGAAISSLNKFLLYGLITSDSLRADVAINRIAVCVARCRFEETHRADDEAVLMKLLELVEFALRCDVGPLITAENVWKMAQLCYSIRCQPRSSLHLARAAENTLAHLVLTVFDRIDELEPKPRDNAPLDAAAADGAASTEPQQAPVRDRNGPYGIALLEQLLQFLAGLIAPSANDEATCVLGLRLINIVLETAGTGLGAHAGLVSVLQSDLSKFLLQNSETDDLAILSLTLRVVFNLFNSIKDHLKVQLEVFFTSVHLRIIDSRSATDEQKELALESLLEFCREPALMLDLYVNYDCDVHCTNLFEVLCKSLARNCHAMESADGSLNALSLLCLEGLLAVIESIARRCPLSLGVSGNGLSNGTTTSNTIAALHGSDLAAFTSGPVTNKHRTASDLSLDEISPMSSVRDLMHLVMSGSESESDSDDGSSTPTMLSRTTTADQLAWLHTARERTAEVLQQRKRAKKRYALAADKFNTDPKHWIAFSQQIGLLPTDKLTPESVASFLLHTPGLNKTLIGDYIGDGPVDKYPFNAAVRDAYIAMFDFRATPTLDAGLRSFLAKFRLPGEAQKIDRMMEAFSKAYFAQASGASPLIDADAAYVLSFSLIMLNTDLHSEHIPKKMTLDEFVRNNRGINGGQDLPRDYLEELYTNIKTNQIEMQHDVSDYANDSESVIDRYSTQWDGVLKRSANVVGASFTSNASILKLRAGLYESEMFSLIAETCISSILLAFEKTCDVTNMERALDGLRNCANVALYFDASDILNRILSALASYFLTFAHRVLSGEKVYVPVTGVGSTGAGGMKRPSGLATAPLTRQSSSDDSRLLTAPRDSHELVADAAVSNVLHAPIAEDHVEGAKTRRALLSLKLLFQFVQTRPEHFRKAWTSVVECILMFNELDVVPTSFVEIDDFVDARGVPLPPVQSSAGSPKAGAANAAPTTTLPTAMATTTATAAGVAGVGLSGKTRERSRRLAERQAAIRSRMKSMSHGHAGTAYGTSASSTNAPNGSIWGSLSSFLWADDDKVDDSYSQVNQLLRDNVAQLGGGVLEKDNWLRLVRKLPSASLTSLLETLLACRDPFKCIVQPSPSSSTAPDAAIVLNASTTGATTTALDAMMQENAILVLELSVDLMLVNAHRLVALELWQPFHLYAKRILSTPWTELNMQGLVERVVVHILRVCIRLFHDDAVRPQLVATLALLLHMDDDMYCVLSDRVATGVNMLLKANLVYMAQFHDWPIVFQLLTHAVATPSGHAPSWDSVLLLAHHNYVCDTNVTLWIALTFAFVRYDTPYAVDALRLLHRFVNNHNISNWSETSFRQETSGGTNGQAAFYTVDSTVWLNVLREMLGFVADDRLSVAKTAYECLYRSLVQPGVDVSSDTWQQCFQDVLFAFDDHVAAGRWRFKDAALHSVTLLTKTFLHNLPTLVALAAFCDLWLEVLRRLATKLVVAGAHAANTNTPHGILNTTPTPAVTNDDAVVVYETTLQSLYNLLLVLKAEDVLETVRTDATTQQQTLFDETCAVIDAVCPHVKDQLGLVQPPAVVEVASETMLELDGGMVDDADGRSDSTGDTAAGAESAKKDDDDKQQASGHSTALNEEVVAPVTASVQDVVPVAEEVVTVIQLTVSDENMNEEEAAENETTTATTTETSALDGMDGQTSSAFESSVSMPVKTDALFMDEITEAV